MNEGYIPLYRKIMDNWLWEDRPFSRGQAWVDLLLLANHSPREILVGGHLAGMGAGDLVTSEVTLAERWGWSRRRVQAFLSLLESQQMIVKKTGNKGTCLTLCNYRYYNDPAGSRRAAKKQRGSTDKHDKKGWNIPSFPPSEDGRRGEGPGAEPAPEPAEAPGRSTTRADLFARFWTAYPRKAGKGAAERAFQKCRPDVRLLTAMLDALEAQKRSGQWQREDGRFIPHPATWLNQRRWEDEPEPPAAAPGNPDEPARRPVRYRLELDENGREVAVPDE